MILSQTISKGRSFREGNHLRNTLYKTKCCFILSLVFACGNYLIWKLSRIQKSLCCCKTIFELSIRLLTKSVSRAQMFSYVFITHIHRDISRWTIDPFICPNENVVWYHKLVLMQLTDEIAPINRTFEIWCE